MVDYNLIQDIGLDLDIADQMVRDALGNKVTVNDLAAEQTKQRQPEAPKPSSRAPWCRSAATM